MGDFARLVASTRLVASNVAIDFRGGGLFVAGERDLAAVGKAHRARGVLLVEIDGGKEGIARRGSRSGPRSGWAHHHTVGEGKSGQPKKEERDRSHGDFAIAQGTESQADGDRGGDRFAVLPSCF